MEISTGIFLIDSHLTSLFRDIYRLTVNLTPQNDKKNSDAIFFFFSSPNLIKDLLVVRDLMVQTLKSRDFQMTIMMRFPVSVY